MTKDKKAIDGNAVRSGILVVTAVALWAALAYGLLRPEPIAWPGGLLLLMAGTLAALMAVADQVQSFSAGANGIEARMRDVIVRAESAITEVQKLAKITGSFMVDTLRGQGYIGSPPDEELEARKQEILNVMREVGLSEGDIEEVRRADKRWVYLDYENGITSGIPTDPSNNDQWREFAARFTGLDNRPPISEIERILAALGDLSPERQALIADLNHYLERGTHRRPQVWMRRHNWGVQLPGPGPDGEG